MAIKISNTTVITDSREITNLGAPLDVSQGGTGAISLGIGVVLGNGVSPVTIKANPAGAFVGTTDIQTLTNKTLGTGTTIVAGSVDNVIVGGTEPAAGTFTTLTATGATSLNTLNVAGSTQLGDFGTDVTTLVGQVVANNSTGSNGHVLTSRGPNLSPQWTVPFQILPGTVMTFAFSTAPTGWLIANGALVSRTSYADLFAAIGVTFGAGDGATTFALPDLRAEFIRGWDNSRGVDAGRVFGSSQADTVGPHTHTFSVTEAQNTGNGNPSLIGFSATGSFETSNTGTVETRPRNVALLYCIKT